MGGIRYREEIGLPITRLVIGRADLNDLRLELRREPGAQDDTQQGWFMGMRVVVTPGGLLGGPYVAGPSGTLDPPAVTVDADGVLTTEQDGRLWRSTDNGMSWDIV
jgi:hypothetical protein